jgi:hypothetical protein
MAQLPRPNKFADDLFDVLVYFRSGKWAHEEYGNMLLNCALGPHPDPKLDARPARPFYHEVAPGQEASECRQVVAIPEVGGLHHRYARRAA